MCDLYYSPASAPCRSIMMLAKAMGVQLNLKFLNLQEGEHLKPEFLKINPQHTIPTLVDNDFNLWESRAILIYLVEKYGSKTSSFYPKDAQKRATINRLMYFDMGTLYQRFADFYYPQYKDKAPADPEKFKKMEEAVGFLDTYLSKFQYAASDEITIADYALFSTFSSFVVVEFDFSKFENVSRWYELCKTTLKGIEENEAGMEIMRKYVDALKAEKAKA